MKTIDENICMNSDFIHLRFEFNRTIEFIKNRMLKFAYYSTLIQGLIIGYNKLINHNNMILLVNISLIFLSLFVASLTTYFIAAYNRDLKFYQYRNDYFIDPQLTSKARICLNVPLLFDSKNINDVLKFCTKKDHHKTLYFFFCNIVSMAAIIYLSSTFNLSHFIVTITFAIFIMCISLYLIQDIIKNNTRAMLEKYLILVSSLYETKLITNEELFRSHLTELIKKLDYNF